LVDPLEDLDAEEWPEKEDIVEEVEKQRFNGGQARSAGVGEIDGDGEEPRVRGGEGMSASSLIIVGVALRTMLIGSWIVASVKDRSYG